MSQALIHADTIRANNSAESRRFSWTVPEVVCCVLLFASACFNVMDIEGNSERNLLNRQVIAKIMLCSLCGLFGLYGALNWGRVTRVLLSFPTVILLLIGITFLLSTLVSIEPRATFAAAILYWMMLLFIVTSLHVLGPLRVLKVIAAAFFAFVVGCWVAFLAFPQFGVFREIIDLEQVQLRMGGLAHPNTLGAISAILAIILIYFGVHKHFSWHFLFIPLALALGALVLSLSRTSMVAFLLSVVFVNRRMLFHKNTVVIACVGAMMLLLGLFFLSLNRDLTMYGNEFLMKLTKSGNLEELTTGTGRLEIWKFAIEKIGDSFWLGNGMATAKILMLDYSGHSHNMWLHFFFTGGVFCGILGIVLTVYLLWRTFFRFNPAIDGIALYLIISGIAEPAMNEPVPGSSTIVLIVATVWTMFTVRQTGRIDAEHCGEPSYNRVAEGPLQNN